MNSRSILASTVVLAAVVTATAGPAMAYDRGAYGHAASSMIERSDIPSALGEYKKTIGFNAYAGGKRIFVCDVPQADSSAPDVVVYMPGPQYSFSGTYQGTGTTDAATVTVTVNQYTGAEAAISAFNDLKKNIKKCAGSGSNTWIDESGTTTTYSTRLSNGVVPSVTTAGVESLFVSNDSLQESTPGDSRFINDDYTVYSLIDDVVIVTDYSANTNKNITTKQRKAVNQVAFNAETRWLN